MRIYNEIPSDELQAHIDKFGIEDTLAYLHKQLAAHKKHMGGLKTLQDKTDKTWELLVDEPEKFHGGSFTAEEVMILRVLVREEIATRTKELMLICDQIDQAKDLAGINTPTTMRSSMGSLDPGAYQ